MEEPPNFFLLNEEDKNIYRSIHRVLSAPTSRNKRNKKIDDFKEIIDAIQIFIDRDEEDAWKRRLVCGVCPLSNGIAVNIKQLGKLIFKCKSSINGSLKGLGYDVVIGKSSKCEELLQKIPYLRKNIGEMRQWTVRVSSEGIKSSGKAAEVVEEEDITPAEAEFNLNSDYVGISLSTNAFIGAPSLENDDILNWKETAGSDFDFSFDFS